MYMLRSRGLPLPRCLLIQPTLDEIGHSRSSVRGMYELISCQEPMTDRCGVTEDRMGLQIEGAAVSRDARAGELV